MGARRGRRAGGREAWEKGLAKEDAAAEHLANAGYEVIERNFRSTFGEIDVVARVGDTLVFVEVRYRKAGGLVTAEESVSREKARRLRLAIRQYVAERVLTESGTPMRVDLCIVRDETREGDGPSFEVIPGIMEFG